MILFCDGASRGNPGPAAYGFVILSPDGDILAQAGAKLGKATNNVAEYEGLLNGLKKCRDLGATSVVIKSDSELMVRQLNGVYKVKAPHIIPLHDQARTLLKGFAKAEVLHVRREENRLADAIANRALDER